MTQSSTVHLPTSSVLSLKKNRSESGEVNLFHASQMYLGEWEGENAENKIKQVSAQISHSDCLDVTHVTDSVVALWISKGNTQCRVAEKETKYDWRL